MTEKKRIFVVDDEESNRAMLQFWLEEEGYEVESFEDGPSCLEAMKRITPDLVCLDLMMTPWDGLEVMQRIKRADEAIPIIFTTAKNAVETAVKAMRGGAFDYQMKPLDPDRMLVSVRNALEQRNLKSEVRRLKAQLHERHSVDGIVGASKKMRKLFQQVHKVATSDVSVMLLGESGTGKELIAQAIHHLSGRSDNPFVDLNCAAIQDSLLESELFGHEKGAFTGAHSLRKGRFERADGGTLFLDEVAEMSHQTQVRLLRVLQERSFERVGGNRRIDVDVRIISATHRNLEQRVGEHSFRQDLYYRLMVFPIYVPALRERTEDIPVLCEHLIKKHSLEPERPVRMDAEVLERFSKHPWPGNVRELENVIQFALVSCEDARIRVSDLPPLYRGEQPQAGSPPAPVGSPVLPAVHSDDDFGADDILSMDEIEKVAIEQALKATSGNVSMAARQLGLGRTTLYRKMVAYGMHVTEKEKSSFKPS